MDTVIVTRQSGSEASGSWQASSLAGLVEWLKRRGVEGEVVAHADESAVKGKRVYGVLPREGGGRAV